MGCQLPQSKRVVHLMALKPDSVIPIEPAMMPGTAWPDRIRRSHVSGFDLQISPSSATMRHHRSGLARPLWSAIYRSARSWALVISHPSLKPLR